jgi:SAM-dependent methyltransferase
MNPDDIPKIRAFTAVTPSYGYSQELALALTMFRKALPAGTLLSISEAGSDSAKELGAAVRHALNQTPLAEYFLIAWEPALLVGPGALEELERILDDFPSVDCVLPSDIRGYRLGCGAGYLTLRGFQQFAVGLRDPEAELTAYDSREPVLFLIRTSALKRIEWPSDPLDIPGRLADRAVISLNAYVHPFLNYYEEERADVVQMVPREVRSILDIGCARGHFGAALKKSLPLCRVVGIEFNGYEAKNARRRLDGVVVGDALAAKLDEWFDCVTCLDMMEHVARPEDLLEKIRQEFLLDGGYLLLSIPNIGHWAVVEDLLAGRWDYLPSGLLSVTHLKFFTLSTIRSLLEDNGFEVLDVDRVSFPMPEGFRAGIQSLKLSGFEIDVSSLTTTNYNILARRGD